MYTLYVFNKINNEYVLIAIINSEGLANLMANSLKQIYSHVYSMKGRGPMKYSAANGLKLNQVF